MKFKYVFMVFQTPFKKKKKKKKKEKKKKKKKKKRMVNSFLFLKM